MPAPARRAVFPPRPAAVRPGPSSVRFFCSSWFPPLGASTARNDRPVRPCRSRASTRIACQPGRHDHGAVRGRVQRCQSSSTLDLYERRRVSGVASEAVTPLGGRTAVYAVSPPSQRHVVVEVGQVAGAAGDRHLAVVLDRCAVVRYEHGAAAQISRQARWFGIT